MSTATQEIPAPGRAPQTNGALRIALIEDSSAYALLVREMLRDAFAGDVDVSAYQSLGEAHSELTRGDAECVLLDLSLPDANGLEALAKVQEVAGQIPIVVLSGQDSEELAIQAVKEGAQDYLVKRRADGELLARSVRYAIERKQAEQELTHQAMHDALTSLPNRALFTDRLEMALAHAERGNTLVAVMFLDLDRFKQINDGLGHDVGDRVLQQVARRLDALVRPSDTVARFGGDEFMVLCDGLDDEREAIVIAERLSEGLEAPFEVDGNEIHVGASIGIAFGSDLSATPRSLVRDADQTMYRAKERSSRYELVEADTTALAVRRFHLESDLHGAIEREELRLHYQPQLDLTNKSVFGVEALLRWEHPDRGLLPPAEFIGLAEQTGLIVPIGEWAIEEACRQLAAWRRSGSCTDAMTVSVNLSPRQLTGRPLAETVARALQTTGIPPRVLCLEITESAVAGEPEAALDTLRGLEALGVLLSLDDFGTGLSSLGALDRYPLDMLKIDRMFVGRLESGLSGQRLFAAVVGVARGLGLRAIAEGVETSAQLGHIARVGCDTVQGFYLCRPSPPEVVEPRLLAFPDRASV